MVESQSISNFNRPSAWFFLINPRAGGKSKSGFRKKVRALLVGVKCDFRKTKPQKGAKKAVAFGRSNGYKGFVAVGGDGTINSLAKELRGTTDILGIIPAGSGNGLAGWLGIPKKLKENLQLLTSGQIIQADTAEVNGIPFINLAGVGFDAAVAHATSKSRLRGLWPYLLSSIRLVFGNIYWKGTVTLDGRSYPGEFLDVIIANGAVFGYGLKIAREAKIDDGLFTVIFLYKVAKWRYLFALPSLFLGWENNFPWMVSLNARHVTIHSLDEPLIHVDGERVETNQPYTFEIYPATLNLIIPTHE